MSPTRVAIWSVAITYVPLLGGLLIWTWISDRPMSVGSWLTILGALALPVAVGFGFRRALFAYMERYVLPDATRRQKGG